MVITDLRFKPHNKLSGPLDRLNATLYLLHPPPDLQTRPPGTEVNSADLARSALERAQEVFADVGAKGCATWGGTVANLVCPGAIDFWETLGPSAQKP